MAQTGQYTYVDLSDGNTVRYGVECGICQARYISQAVDLASIATPDALRDVQHDLLDGFDEAFQEVTTTCFRCHRTACPECWDSDHRMCAECVQRRGLARTPYRGQPTSSPFAEGRIQRVAPGTYSDIARPDWLDRLIVSNPTATSASGWANPARPYAPLDSAEPTHVLGDRAGVASDSSSPGQRPSETRDEDTSELRTLEGAATSNMVTCPRCGTANFDFVTRCSACQLQLIQICPECERLNPGHLTFCEACGSSLTRPQGWSSVYEIIRPVAARLGTTEEPADDSSPLPIEQASTIQHPTPVPARRVSQGPARKSSGPVLHSITGSPALPSVMPVQDVSPPYEPPASVPNLTYRTASAAYVSANRYHTPSRLRLLQYIVAEFGGFSTLLFWLLVFVVGGTLAAVVVSPNANQVVQSVIHVNLRELMLTVVQDVQQILRTIAATR